MPSILQTPTRLAAYLQSLQRFGIAPGLERIRALLQRAGNPQLEYPVVLVGGTNGKGSTCEFLARLLAEEGKRVGLFTSPHLYHWNERIRVLKSEVKTQKSELFPGAISNQDLDALFDEALPYIEIVANSPLGQPTEFEVLTFLGFRYFAQQKIDVAVVEVGLGGKWDATNACEPIVSVITHVALDHCDRLGNTLEAIASDKIHIARQGKFLVTSETKLEVLEVFEKYCRNINCHIHKVPLPCGADFQQVNFATALAAKGVLCRSLDWPQTPHSALRTPHSAVPGRFETIAENPRVILDGANNPDGAQTLATQLQDALNQTPGARLILVLGILADKDWAAMIEILAPLAAVVIATQSDSPRAASATLIAAQSRKFCAHVEQSTPSMAAFARALESAHSNDIICVTGSFYTIAEIERGNALSD